MAIDPTISLKAEQPNVANTMGSFLDLGNKALAFQKGKATFAADIAQRQAESRTAGATADVAEANVQPLIQQQQAQTQSAQNAAHASLLSLNDQQRNTVGQFIAAQNGLPPQTVKTKLDALSEFQPQLKPAIDYMWQTHMAPNVGDPKAFSGAVKNVGMAVLTVPEQLQARTSAGPIVSNNQQTAMINQAPYADTAMGAAAPGTTQQMQLPPTTPTFNAQTNTPTYLGPQARGAGGAGPVAAAPSLGTEQNVAGTVKAVNDDWADTTSRASTAAQDIGVLQNIKSHAAGAITGQHADLRQTWNGLAALTGLTSAQVAKMDTDLLAKNSSMLALAGGNTDAARSLAEAANPNSHMDPTAIVKAANQIIAQRQLSLVKQKYLGQFRGDPNAYQQNLSKFNQVADPRILQWSNMSAAEKSQLKSAMSSEEQQAFRSKMHDFEQMGLDK